MSKLSPDRKLTHDELYKFLQEAKEGKLSFVALLALLEEKTEPSLHDLCLHELHGIAEALKEGIIQQGRDIETLKDKIKVLEKKRETTKE